MTDTKCEVHEIIDPVGDPTGTFEVVTLLKVDDGWRVKRDHDHTFDTRADAETFVERVERDQG